MIEITPIGVTQSLAFDNIPDEGSPTKAALDLAAAVRQPWLDLAARRDAALDSAKHAPTAQGAKPPTTAGVGKVAEAGTAREDAAERVLQRVAERTAQATRAGLPLSPLPAPPGAVMAWTGTTYPMPSLKSCFENWRIIFGEHWRTLLESGTASRDAGVAADAAIAQTGRDTGFHRSTVTGFWRGAGLVVNAPQTPKSSTAVDSANARDAEPLGIAVGDFSTD